MEYRRLSELCEITSGGTPSRANQNYWNGSIPWVKIGDINQKYVYKTSENITEEGANNSSAKLVAKGSILYTIFATLGTVGILEMDACTNQAIASLSIKDGMTINKEYLYYYLKSTKRRVESLGRGVAQNNINLSILKQFNVPVPSINQQRKIVEVLDSVDNQIMNREKEIQLLDNLIKSRFVEMMKIAKQNGDYSDEISLEQITTRVKVGFVGTCEKYYTDTLGVPMLRTGNITSNGIDMSDLKYVTKIFHEKNQKSKIHNGDLLIARHGSNGQANVYYGKEAQCLNAVIIIPNNDYAKSVFLAGLINSSQTKKQINKFLVGSTQHVINTKSIANLRVHVPSLKYQEQYENFVMQVDKSKFAVQKSLDETQQLFDSLMQQYFG